MGLICLIQERILQLGEIGLRVFGGEAMAKTFSVFPQIGKTDVVNIHPFVLLLI